MKAFAHSENVVRFGVFEVNLQTGETRKHGIRIKLQGQPYQILLMLLERPGEIVKREEMRHRLWPADTFVEFEDSVHTAIKKLRQALGDLPEQPRYIETIPRVGYRFIAPVEKRHVLPIGAATEADAPTSIPAPAASGQVEANANHQGSALRGWTDSLSRRIFAFVLGVAVLAIVGAYFRWFRHRVDAQPRGGRLMLAVLPFENLTGDAGQEYFSDGLTEEMISQLGRIDPQRLGVIARTSVMQYKQNPKPLDQVGKELGVEYVLEGSVRRDANTVRVSAQLIQVRDQTHLLSRQYDRELTSLLALQGEIAQEVADEIQLTLGDKSTTNVAHAASRTISEPPTSYEAYDLYLKGRYYWNKRTEAGFHQAADYFQQAIAKDPKYAPSYAGLADTLALLSDWDYVPAKEFMPKARANALKGLQIDDSLAEGHASLALIAEQYYYDWQTAEKEFRRSVELDPDYATAHQWYAECLSLQGRFEEALAESERARELDPLSLIIATDHAVILFYSRQYDRAIEQFQAVREMEPDFPRSGIIFNAYIEEGRYADALAEAEDLGRRHKAEGTAEFFASKAYVYGRWGRRTDAERAFASFEEQSRLHPPSREDPPWFKLNAYMAVGRKDDVIAVLERNYSERTSLLVRLKVDPFFDPLRSDPRFQDLLRRANLAQ